MIDATDSFLEEVVDRSNTSSSTVALALKLLARDLLKFMSSQDDCWKALVKCQHHKESQQLIECTSSALKDRACRTRLSQMPEDLMTKQTLHKMRKAKNSIAPATSTRDKTSHEKIEVIKEYFNFGDISKEQVVMNAISRLAFEPKPDRKKFDVLVDDIVGHIRASSGVEMWRDIVDDSLALNLFYNNLGNDLIATEQDCTFGSFTIDEGVSPLQLPARDVCTIYKFCDVFCTRPGGDAKIYPEYVLTALKQQRSHVWFVKYDNNKIAGFAITSRKTIMLTPCRYVDLICTLKYPSQQIQTGRRMVQEMARFYASQGENALTFEATTHQARDAYLTALPDLKNRQEEVMSKTKVEFTLK